MMGHRHEVAREHLRPATGQGTMVSSRIPPAIVLVIDDWASKNDTTRSDAIRQLVELGLKAKK
jgi:hypothetical protein